MKNWFWLSSSPARNCPSLTAKIKDCINWSKSVVNCTWQRSNLFNEQAGVGPQHGDGALGLSLIHISEPTRPY